MKTVIHTFNGTKTPHTTVASAAREAGLSPYAVRNYFCKNKEVNTYTSKCGHTIEVIRK